MHLKVTQELTAAVTDSSLQMSEDAVAKPDDANEDNSPVTKPTDESPVAPVGKNKATGVGAATTEIPISAHGINALVEISAENP